MSKSVSAIDPKGGDFKNALRTLASDPTYRAAAMSDPRRITTDFKLNTKELFALREAAVMSGADITAVNNVIRDMRATKSSGTSSVIAPDEPQIDIDIDCCCCCCCCCGEAAVAPLN